ncbi:hypothetical protein [Roseovarius sp. 2305UL8-3]|uniref:hypothetical protein n=1 Tax=Roseovarius conchicola TaxID=3121636 RepID=UPI003528CC2F
MSRYVALFSILIFYGHIATPPVHWSDRGVFYEIFLLAFWLFVSLTYLAFIVRYMLEQQARRKDARGSLGRLVEGCDFLLAVAATGLVTVYIFICVGWFVEGSDRPMQVHLLIGGVCICAAVVALGSKSVGVRLSAVVFSIMTPLLLVWSYFWYPEVVLKAAKVVSQDARYCIYLESRKRGATRRSDLSFLTLDKNRGRPHVSLIFRYGDETQYRYWSYYQSSFRSLYWPSKLACDPYGLSESLR